MVFSLAFLADLVGAAHRICMKGNSSRVQFPNLYRGKELSMKQWVIRVIVSAALVSVGFFLGHATNTVHAQAQPDAIPSSWGSVVGVYPGTIVLSDGNQTIRFVDVKTLQVIRLITRVIG
jgi:hypothetical protein